MKDDHNLPCRYDDEREAFVLLLEDLGLRDLTPGDQITGGPSEGAPPDLEAFTTVFKAVGDLNGKYFNATKEVWTDGEHEIDISTQFWGPHSDYVKAVFAPCECTSVTAVAAVKQCMHLDSLVSTLVL